MLPPFGVCQERIKAFKKKFPCSTFNEFWEYKHALEEKGCSILDDDNLGKTARRLEETLLWNPEWGLAQTGIPRHDVVKEILTKVAPDYAQIRHIRLGEGNIEKARKNLGAVYEELCGITNARQRNDVPVDGEFLIVGKTKVLMFMWGQTPGFDRILPIPMIAIVAFSVSLTVLTGRSRYLPRCHCHSLANIEAARIAGRVVCQKRWHLSVNQSRTQH